MFKKIFAAVFIISSGLNNAPALHPVLMFLKKIGKIAISTSSVITFSSLLILMSQSVADAASFRLVTVLFSGFSTSSSSSKDNDNGMKELNRKLKDTFGRQKDITFVSEVFDYTETDLASSFIQELKNDFDFLLLIGHSLGGGATMNLAENLLNKDIDIDKVILLDPVPYQDTFIKAPRNVEEVINYYQTATGDFEIQGEKNIFTTRGANTIVNSIDVESKLGVSDNIITHTNIDTDEKFNKIESVFDLIVKDIENNTGIEVTH